MRVGVRTADQSTIAWWDRLAVFWVALWLLVGAAAAVTIWQIADIGDTISSSGDSLQTAGKAISGFAGVPLIGDDAAKLGSQVTTTSADVSSSGQDVKSQLRRLAVLLGVVITLMPILPILGLYVPDRLARRRELGEIDAALRREEDRAQVDGLLAQRALEYLSFADLAAVSPDPRADIARGETRGLADAELRRLGLVRP